MNIYDMPHDAYVSHPGLPKAAFLSINLRGFDLRRKRLTKMRAANAARIEFFGIDIVVRRPWLAGPARQLHPELFTKEASHDNQ